MSSRMEFDFDFQTETRTKSTHSEQKPFSILVLGDFSGATATGRGGAMAAARRVDVDNIDDLWQVFQPNLSLELDGGEILFEPGDIDHFHPDHLFHALPAFSELRQLRARLLNAETSADALAEILGGAPPVPTEQKTDEPAPAPQESSDDMFERLLGQKPGTDKRAPRPQPASRIDSLIRNIVAPHIVHDPDPKVEAAVDSIDLGLAELMRKLLHHAAFQELESNWRALYELVQNTETEGGVQITVCNLRKTDLMRALPESSSEFQSSALFKLLVERFHRGGDAVAPAVIAGMYEFDDSVDDLALLGALGAVADMNDAAFLGAATPVLIGSIGLAEQPDFHQWNDAAEGNPLWRNLRQGPLAPRIGLALPRLLGRLPYGRATDPVNVFEFEEMPSPEHEHFLWVNPVLALTRLLADSFVRYGWNMKPGGALDIGELPMFVHERDGERIMQPCAEALLPESSVEAILQKGIMAIASFKNRDVARLIRFQSIAEPLAALRGPWS